VCKGDVACAAEEITNILAQNCSALLIAHVYMKEDISEKSAMQPPVTSRKTLITQDDREGAARSKKLRLCGNAEAWWSGCRGLDALHHCKNTHMCVVLRLRKRECERTC
jgi:hypothetical protein